MSIETGITIDGVQPYTDDLGVTRTTAHTYRDLGLILATYYIPQPKVKEKRISIPFASGSVDLTEGAGYIPYEDRNGVKFEFLMKNTDYLEYNYKVQAINNMLHGRKLKIILDTDPSYYYLGRLELDETKTNKIFSRLTITGVTDPFKYDITASNEPWIWDTFNFYTGRIDANTSDIDVNGVRNVTIPAGGILTAPTFYVYSSENLKVICDDVTYNLPKNSVKAYEVYRFPQIKVGDTSVQLKFTGKGRVSIEYRGRYL